MNGNTTFKKRVNSGGRSKVSTKYFCESTENEAKICMQLESQKGSNEIARLPHCWIVVIDVSGSMNDEGKDGMTMLDRVKTFVNLAAELTSDLDSMSIISFSNNAQTELAITTMDSEGKKKVFPCLQALKATGGTNIEAGLVHALAKIISARQSGMLNENATASIIIFTDGGANAGITNGTDLVKKYQEIERSIGENTRIPLSAFTVAGGRPALLEEMSNKLGSEAFYWLDEGRNFEADMLLPFELRLRSLANDIHVTMVTMNGATFIHRSEVHLIDDSPTRLGYFVHMLPLDWPKVFQVRLALPSTALEQQIDLGVLDVCTTYSDETGQVVRLNDVVRLTGKSLFESLTSQQQERRQISPLPMDTAGNGGGSEERMTILQQTSSFIYHADKNRQTLWSEAKTAIMVIARLECFRLILKLISQSEAKEVRNDSSLAFDRIRQRVKQIVNNDNDPEYRGWLEEIETVKGNVLGAAESQQCTAARLASMASALEKDMPVPKGIFDKSCKWDGTEFTQHAREVIQDAKENLGQSSNDTSAKALANIMKEKNSFERLQKLKEDFAKDLQHAREALKQQTLPIFTDDLFRNVVFVLSEKLENKDTLQKNIMSHRGEVERDIESRQVNMNMKQVYLVMELDGATADSTTFQKATKMKVPIVKSTFIEACIEESKIVGWHFHAVKRNPAGRRT